MLIYAHAREREWRPAVRVNGILITIQLVFTYDWVCVLWLRFVKLICKFGKASIKPFVKEIRR